MKKEAVIKEKPCEQAKLKALLLLEDVNKILDGFRECSFYIDSNSYISRAQQTLIGTIMSIQETDKKENSPHTTITMFNTLQDLDISESIFQESEKFINKQALVGYLSAAYWLNKFEEELHSLLFLDTTHMMNNFINDLVDIFVIVFGHELVIGSATSREAVYTELTKGRPEDIVNQFIINKGK